MKVYRCDLCGEIKDCKNFKLPRFRYVTRETFSEYGYGYKQNLELHSIDTDLCEECQLKIALLFDKMDKIAISDYYKTKQDQEENG